MLKSANSIELRKLWWVGPSNSARRNCGRVDRSSQSHA